MDRCSGCEQESRYLTAMTWPDGSTRGDFCIECRNWLAKHRNSPIVMIGQRIQKTDTVNRRTRTYRNDTSGDFYQLTRDLRGQFFIAYGPSPAAEAPTVFDLSPLKVGGVEHWGRDFSWSKAEKKLIKLLS